MIHINRFIDKIAGAEAKNLKQVGLSMQEAKGLHSDITKLLLVMQTLQQGSSAGEPHPDNEVQKVEIDGGTW